MVQPSMGASAGRVVPLAGVPLAARSNASSASKPVASRSPKVKRRPSINFSAPDSTTTGIFHALLNWSATADRLSAFVEKVSTGLRNVASATSALVGTHCSTSGCQRSKLGEVLIGGGG